MRSGPNTYSLLPKTSATGSGTITLRVLKPDPMPVADQRDAGPYLRAVCARGVGGWWLAVRGKRGGGSRGMRGSNTDSLSPTA